MIDPYRSSPSWINTAGTFNSSNPNAQMSWFDKLKSNMDTEFLAYAAASMGSALQQPSSRGSVDIGSSAPMAGRLGKPTDFQTTNFQTTPQITQYAPLRFKSDELSLGGLLV